MWTRQLVAGAAIVGGVALNLVGLAGIAVDADASPPVIPADQEPAIPTITIEPAPSAPLPDTSSDTGITSSTDIGSGAPAATPSDPGGGAPSNPPAGVDAPARPTAHPASLAME